MPIEIIEKLPTEKVLLTTLDHALATFNATSKEFTSVVKDVSAIEILFQKVATGTETVAQADQEDIVKKYDALSLSETTAKMKIGLKTLSKTVTEVYFLLDMIHKGFRARAEKKSKEGAVISKKHRSSHADRKKLEEKVCSLKEQLVATSKRVDRLVIVIPSPTKNFSFFSDFFSFITGNF